MGVAAPRSPRRSCPLGSGSSGIGLIGKYGDADRLVAISGLVPRPSYLPYGRGGGWSCGSVAELRSPRGEPSRRLHPSVA